MKKGDKMSESSRKKMSEARKRFYQNNKSYWEGKKRSIADRIKFSISHLGKTLSKETKEKLSISHKGNRHWNWKEDRTSIKKSEHKHKDTLYKIWSQGVKSRDKWKCQLADENCKGKLEAHHIFNWSEYKELRYQLNNGISLCHAHHPRGRAKEKRLEAYFMGLVSVSK